ncbi:expressed unknown protein [Seminavis robusta]|uniref:Uncharacterized protein n=1 Tax=Seminavis robusta TaxID=568900 RepID=A0A9N8EDS6_9STRA|nr:expressed unknown protein [Seminavis robusta]|eukprot:Sro943_g222830.1 n/a (199) ;mRNA; f:32738-33334
MAPGPERFVQFVRIYFPNLPENFDDRITQLAQAPQAILVGRQDDSDQDTSSLGVLSAGAAARGGNAVVVAPAPQAIIEQGQDDGGQYGGTLGSADREQLMQGSVMTGVAGSRSGDETAGVASLVRAIWAAGASDVPSVQDLEPLHDPQEGTTAVSLQGSGQGNVEDETTSRPVVSQEEGEKEDEEEEKKPRAKKPRID